MRTGKKEYGFRTQWEKLEGASLREKSEYLLSYYGIYVVVAVATILLLANVINSAIQNSYPTVVSGDVFTGTLSVKQTEALVEYLCEKEHIDSKKNRIDITSELIETPNDSELYYSVRSRNIARMAAADLDFMVGNPSMLESFMDKENRDNCFFYDLRSVIPESLYGKLLKDDRIEWFQCGGELVPFAVRISESNLSDFFVLSDQTILLGITNDNSDAAVLILDYIYS